jgi:hypothetical protein
LHWKWRDCHFPRASTHILCYKFRRWSYRYCSAPVISFHALTLSCRYPSSVISSDPRSLLVYQCCSAPVISYHPPYAYPRSVISSDLGSRPVCRRRSVYVISDHLRCWSYRCCSAPVISNHLRRLSYRCLSYRCCSAPLISAHSPSAPCRYLCSVISSNPGSLLVYQCRSVQVISVHCGACRIGVVRCR